MDRSGEGMAALLSMTGFGAASSEAAGLVVRVEVRSVNHRGLQVKVRSAADLGALESEVEARVRARVARGSLTVAVDAVRTGEAASEGLDVAAAERWADSLRRLALELGIEGHVTLEQLLALPGVVAAGGAGSLATNPAERAAVLACVDDALSSLDEMRAREGEALGRDLLDNARAVERICQLVRARMPEVVRAHHEALRTRLADLIGAAVPAPDLAREAALIADRMDVGEELTRLDSHLHQLRTSIAGGGPIGRKLDFLAQELFREANTTGAKCGDADVAHLVVDLKTHIERMREQVQNVE